MELQPGAFPVGVSLDRGRVLTLLSQSMGGLVPVAGEGNLTGSRVTATKPVAVFAGNVAAREPVDNLVCCADHLEEQMLPLEAWGAGYVAAPPVNPNNAGTVVKASYRVVAGYDGTTLSYSPVAPPGAPATLDAYDVAYFVTDQPFTVKGSQPFGVAQFHVGAQATSQATDANGDPAMVVLPAVDQFQDSYVFLVPPTYEASYVTVVRPVGTTTELDGAAVAGAAMAAGTIDGVDYEAVQVPVGEGAHRIVGDMPFEILVHGYADFISYAYPGGSGVGFVSEPPPVPEG